jgi:ATP-dependent RNA helicase DbpA
MNTNNFSNYAISEAMLEILAGMQYTAATPIQAESLPYILEDRDVLIQAKTGSGKTAAFGIGLLSKLQVEKQNTQALVLCPTRELADQVSKEIRLLARFTSNIKVLTLYGGQPFSSQLSSLRHPAQVIVGTPGRILKHLKNESFQLDSLETLVIDEAHRMLDMGFIEEIKSIIEYAPVNRQTLLFSATYPDEILELSSVVQKDAVSIKTISTESANEIEEHFYQVETEEKLDALLKILSRYKPENAIVFCNTKTRVKMLAADLRSIGIDAIALQGGLQQNERTAALVQFANNSYCIMVATDVAARGLDIKELSMVVNYDLPLEKSIYTHRIGRTGRAGMRGQAASLFTDEDAAAAKSFREAGVKFESTETLISDDSYSGQSGNRTLVIEGGKKDKLRPGDILGALTGDAGIAGNAIGKIDTFDSQTFVAISRSEIELACSNLKKGKIKKRKFPVWIIRD